jgi:hypothetical protein
MTALPCAVGHLAYERLVVSHSWVQVSLVLVIAVHEVVGRHPHGSSTPERAFPLSEVERLPLTIGTMKIKIELDTEESSCKFHPDHKRNVERLDQLGPMNEGAAACGVLRLLALHLPAAQFADLVESGRLIVTCRVQECAKVVNRASLERTD